MSLSMYQASVPVFLRGLDNLAHVVGKGAAHAAAKNIEPSVFFNARLYPDMLPFKSQIQIASDAAKGAGARLAGLEIPNFEDNEANFEDLQQRITKTQTFLRSLNAAQIDGSEERPVLVKMRSGDLNFSGQAYLLGFALPNFFFHITTAYDILRHNGVELSKKDFLGKP